MRNGLSIISLQPTAIPLRGLSAAELKRYPAMERLPNHVAHDTREEWRDLGYHYVSDDAAKEWHLHGSASGLLGFVRSLESYAANPANAAVSEHEHLGPHMYLTLTTWPSAELDGRGIFGQPKDLLRLAHHLRESMRTTSAGAVLRISHQYTPTAGYTLCLHVKQDTFDPASLDPQLAG